jgi:hypothetical protein
LHQWLRSASAHTAPTDMLNEHVRALVTVSVSAIGKGNIRNRAILCQPSDVSTDLPSPPRTVTLTTTTSTTVNAFHGAVDGVVALSGERTLAVHSLFVDRDAVRTEHAQRRRCAKRQRYKCNKRRRRQSPSVVLPLIVDNDKQPPERLLNKTTIKHFNGDHHAIIGFTTHADYSFSSGVWAHTYTHTHVK